MKLEVNKKNIEEAELRGLTNQLQLANTKNYQKYLHTFIQDELPEMFKKELDIKGNVVYVNQEGRI